MICDRCPCPDICDGGLCAWANEQPQDPVKILAIRNRARLARGETTEPGPGMPVDFEMLEAALLIREATPPSERKGCCG